MELALLLTKINPILTDTKTGKVILKMESLDYVSYSKFVIGPHSLFVYSETTTFPDDESLPWFDGSIYDIKKKKRSWENPIAVAIFSPDGLATWDWDTKIFRDVETQKTTFAANSQTLRGQNHPTSSDFG